MLVSILVSDLLVQEQLLLFNRHAQFVRLCNSGFHVRKSLLIFHSAKNHENMGKSESG